MATSASNATSVATNPRKIAGDRKQPSLRTATSIDRAAAQSRQLTVGVPPSVGVARVPSSQRRGDVLSIVCSSSRQAVEQFQVVDEDGKSSRNLSPTGLGWANIRTTASAVTRKTARREASVIEHDEARGAVFAANHYLMGRRWHISNLHGCSRAG